ncbi:Uncharacterized protein FWK35_00020875 [Aphis craccivora]|uniref:Uncharacterized protein n=1 Tax=Aphis craccivora TaxID=307492 RepID=A0A6G0XMI3_APHCR|nr:Uncharacterized protein FWK35_00020875 [Aphis craccivora]
MMSVMKRFKLIFVLDSEQSDECIDFTMMGVLFFFVSVYSITSRNNDPISNFEGGFRCKNEYPWCITVYRGQNSNFYEICRKRENLQDNSS